LAELLERRQLTRLELQSGSDKLVLERKATQADVAAQPLTQAPAHRPGCVNADVNPAEPETGRAAVAAQPARIGADDASDLPQGTCIRAPLLGTVYRAKAPGAEPFVKEGSKVQAGDTLCLIEAMKLISEVTAPTDGVVKAVNFQDGDLVEYNAVLFVIG